MNLNDALLAQQIATIKHATELGQSVVPYLNEMKSIIRKKVAGFDSENRTAKRLETMLNTLANTLNKPAGAWLAELEKSLKDFAKYEFESIDRDSLGADELDMLASLENRNSVLIGRDVDRETRKEVLLQMASDMRNKMKLLSSR